MSEATYSISVTESERTALAKALGALVTKFINAPLQINAESGTDQARAILSPPSAKPPSTLPAAAPHPAPIERRDRWARDRKGNELPNPTGAEPVEVNLSKTEQSKDKKYLRVTWQNDGQGFGNANCFDEKLWPWIISQTGRRTKLYVVRKGNYTNIVGVCA